MDAHRRSGGGPEVVRRCYDGLLRPRNGPRGPRRPRELLFWYFRWRWRSGGRRGFLWPFSSPSMTVESDRQATSRRPRPEVSRQAPRWCLSLWQQNRREKFNTIHSQTLRSDAERTGSKFSAARRKEPQLCPSPFWFCHRAHDMKFYVDDTVVYCSIQVWVWWVGAVHKNETNCVRWASDACWYLRAASGLVSAPSKWR